MVHLDFPARDPSMSACLLSSLTVGDLLLAVWPDDSLSNADLDADVLGHVELYRHPTAGQHWRSAVSRWVDFLHAASEATFHDDLPSYDSGGVDGLEPVSTRLRRKVVLEGGGSSGP